MEMIVKIGFNDKSDDPFEKIIDVPVITAMVVLDPDDVMCEAPDTYDMHWDRFCGCVSKAIGDVRYRDWYIDSYKKVV